jgi:HEAT repeat protein
MKSTFRIVPALLLALAMPSMVASQKSTRESRSMTTVITLADLPASVAQSVAIATSAATVASVESAMEALRTTSIVFPSLFSSNETERQADSALRVAKRVFEDGDFREAARLFARLAERYPRSAQAPEALYWRAFSLFRAGNSSNLSDALTALDDLKRLYPSSSANQNDGATLRVRVCGELARRGDEACAREVVTAASAGSSAGAGSATSTTRSQGATQNCPRDDDDNDERIMALNALLNMGSESAVPILEKVLARRDDCSRALRKKAVFLISQKRTENVVDILIKVAREDPSPEVREQAVFWLSNVRDPRVVDLLAEMAMNNSDAAIQEKAIFSLSNTRSERASQILRDIAQRETASKNAREQAIFWLGNRRDAQATEFLKSLYGRLTDKDLKDRVIFSIANQRGPGSGEWLINIAMNERESIEVRKQALFWAGNQRAASVTDIATLYDRIGDKEMKEQIIFVLSQNKAEPAVDKLMDIARRDSDKELRSKAIFWLGQSRDPRVLKFLEELINR